MGLGAQGSELRFPLRDLGEREASMKSLTLNPKPSYAAPPPLTVK